MSLDPHVERVINWRESFVVLPDSHFFELIRMYLGEIHSPFNKQKLVEQLGAFLRKTENQKTIISLLSESDVQLLAAVKFIENTTQEKLSSFFHGTFTFTQLYERLLNLEERLLIYRYADKKMNRQIIAINPMLEDVLAPYITIEKILYKPEIAKVNFDVNTALSPELIASFISFVNKNRDLCKADGSLKKRTAGEAEKYFGNRTDLLQALTTAFINLSLLTETAEGFEINQSRLKNFAELDDEKQYAYLCVASYGHFSRSTLVRQARLLIDTAFAAGDSGYTREVILRQALLISEKQNDAPGVSAIGGTSRFAQMMARAQAESQESVVNNAADGREDGGQVMDRLFETAVMMGFFDHKGRTDDGKDVFVTGYFLKNRALQNPNSAGGAKVLSLDAAFNVTVMPGLKLRNLISLVSFMDLKQFDTAAVFEINKKSVMRAFDAGLTQERILGLLSDYSAYEIPQNICVSINDWNSSYSSANLYKGYILQVNKENARIVEKNPAIASHISKVLTEGIYLLDVLDDEEMKEIIERSGLDFIGKVKETERRNEGAAFPDFAWEIRPQTYSEESENLQLSTDVDRCSHFDAMRNALEAMNMGPEQKDGLLLRIRRKIILSPEQLKPESVHFERIEAGGMDFSGKVHIIESAITSNCLVEIEYEDKRINEGKTLQVIGKPLSVEKHEYDSSVRMLLQPDNVEQTFSISHATYVKKVRGSILK